jgi:hypothetical protein
MQNFQKVSDSELWSPFSIINGRVNALDVINNNFNFKQQSNKINEDNTNMTSRNISNTELSNLFFSQMNIDALQKGLRNLVYERTNQKTIIGKQDETELKIIMRSIFLQYGKNQNSNIIQQIRELNGLVLNWAVPEIISNLKQHEIYKKDISTLPMPLERAQLTTQKGTRVLEIKSFM